MNTEVFRRTAHEVVDWMADYLDTVEQRPVRAETAPGAVAGEIPASPPPQGESPDRLIEDFRRVILPGMTHWQHPSFFAYFPANSSRASVLAEMLTATLAAQCMSWETSPAATELETRMLEWLRHMLGLPADFEGSIQDTASVATLCAILAARERATAFRSNDAGVAAVPPLAVYASSEAHSSVVKAVKIAGLGQEALRLIPVDAHGAMRVDALRQRVTGDVANGITPACVVACLGTTGYSGIDPLAAIADVCRDHHVWLHVDAAWAGTALLLPEMRWMIDGIESADSFVFNPHKWMFTNFDCSAFFVRDRAALLRTFQILPEYLKTETEGVINYRDWGIQLGRRFRALKLWFVIRSFGVEGLQARVRDHIRWAHELASWIQEDVRFELLASPVLSLLGFRYRPPGVEAETDLDDLNARLLRRLNDSGALYLTHTRVDDRFAIRFVVGQTNTERRHVVAAWERIRETAASLSGDAVVER